MKPQQPGQPRLGAATTLPARQTHAMAWQDTIFGGDGEVAGSIKGAIFSSSCKWSPQFGGSYRPCQLVVPDHNSRPRITNQPGHQLVPHRHNWSNRRQLTGTLNARGGVTKYYVWRRWGRRARGVNLGSPFYSSCQFGGSCRPCQLVVPDHNSRPRTTKRPGHLLVPLRSSRHH